MMYAASRGLAGNVQLLLAAGADVSAVDVLGRNALHWGIHGAGGVQVIRLLLAAGAPLDAKAGSGAAPLIDAAAENQVGVVLALLEAGAEPATFDRDGRAPLHWAADAGNVWMAKHLLAYGASTLVRNRQGLSPRDLAMREGHLGMAKLLAAAEERERLRHLQQALVHTLATPLRMLCQGLLELSRTR
jgi:ankyrin repeat protein